MPDLKMPDINKVELAGNLTRDPQLKYLPSGQPVCEFSLAVSRKYKDKKTGEVSEDKLFVNCKSWGATAEYVGERLKKGAPVHAEGKLTMETWTDKATGQNRSSLKVTAFRVQHMAWEDSKGGNGRGGYVGAGARSQGRPAPRPIEEPLPDDEDDLPF